MDPFTTSDQRRVSGQVGEVLPFPQQLSVFVRNNTDWGGSSQKVTSQHASPGREDVASLLQGHGRSASERDCTAYSCSGHMLLLCKRAAFCPVHVYYPGTQLGRALSRAQVSGIAAASPAFCQEGWISLSNEQEAVWPLPATCLIYLLCSVWARDMLGAQLEQDLSS